MTSVSNVSVDQVESYKPFALIMLSYGRLRISNRPQITHLFEIHLFNSMVTPPNRNVTSETDNFTLIQPNI